jgi:hypothetical protein
MSSSPSSNGIPKPSTNGHAAAPPLNPVVTDKSGRDEKGRFSTGNRAACGNPVNRRMSELRCSLLKALDEDKMRILGDRLYQRALDGDMVAAGLLLRYCIGVPRECPDADGLDQDEWQRLRSLPSKQALFVAMTDAVPVDEALDAMRIYFAVPRSKRLDPEKLNVTERELLNERDERRRFQRKRK